jgi:uncharacterized membrane protein YfcA
MGSLSDLVIGTSGGVHLTTGRALVLVLAGAGAGVVNGVAGGGTLVSFPVLLWLGYPALTANVTSTVGIWPGYLGGVASFRTQIGDQSDRLRTLAAPAVAGAGAGAALLLTTPATAFERLAPWLVLLAVGLFALQIPLTRAFRGVNHDHVTRRAMLFGGTFLIAVYGGYFGAGMGVMLLAVLGLALPDTLDRTGGLRTALSVLVNGVAAAVFIFHAHLAWEAVALLAAGSLFGGYLGGHAARRLPVPVLRVTIIAIGLTTAIKLLVG